MNQNDVLPLYDHMRSNRILLEGAAYHVTARTNRQELLMDAPAMKELFLNTIRRAKKRYRFAINNLCILGNHFHMIITPGPGECLSRILQWILSVFAMAYNKILGIDGHVWGRRFFSRVIQGMADFLKTFLYIEENPVIANLVASPGDWDYGRSGLLRRGFGDLLAESGVVGGAPNHSSSST